MLKLICRQTVECVVDIERIKKCVYRIGRDQIQLSNNGHFSSLWPLNGFVLRRFSLGLRSTLCKSVDAKICSSYRFHCELASQQRWQQHGKRTANRNVWNM